MEEKSFAQHHQHLLSNISAPEAHLVRQQHGVLRITAAFVADASLVEFILKAGLPDHIDSPLVPSPTDHEPEIDNQEGKKRAFNVLRERWQQRLSEVLRAGRA